MDIAQYLRECGAQLTAGRATESSYRSALEALLKAALPGVRVTNEPRQIACGAPDFVLTRGQIPLGYVETKALGKNLDDKTYREQFKRYAAALDNLILTDYLEFRLIRDGKNAARVCIGDIAGGKIKPHRDAFAALQDLLREFGAHDGVAITNADSLAEHMAAKARMLSAAVADALAQDQNAGGGEFQDQFDAFDKHLITDIKAAEFADIYAQTIAYGLFAARLYDDAPADFSRKKAAELIPENNPFLRWFFQQIAGYDLDKRIRWIVDALADILRIAAVEELMAEYGKAVPDSDPFLHFYETFLGAYDSAQRKKRGVYYTPQPVVDFIVRATDDILRGEFALQDGLASTATTFVESKTGNGKNGSQKPREEVHAVQILDPATGTGTFPASIVRHIYDTEFARKKQQGIWPEYVHKHLLPRLHGFEVLMAPYVMAHIKLEMVLRETNCKLNERAQIFLTNTLTEPKQDILTKFARRLSDEANHANRVKRSMPVMVVIGNPPYSGHSANKGPAMKETTDLLRSYKREPGGDARLKEKNSKWLNDDYVKFIRYGQHRIVSTGKGVLAYITNHGFLDNPTFRGMRWDLLQNFDEIYIIDLHGNARDKETVPGGGADENVFDIMLGVSINLFVKTGKKKTGAAARVFHADVYGKRETKFQFLREHDLKNAGFAELSPAAPQYFFVPKDYALYGEYARGFSLQKLFPVNSVGIVTARDKFTIHHTPQELQNTIDEFRKLDDESAREKFSLGADVRDWKVRLAREDLEKMFAAGNTAAVPISYRPFDVRYTYYTGNSKGFHCMPRGKVMRHFLGGENTGLIFQRGSAEEKTAPVFVTKHISGSRSWSRPGMQGIETSAPLYTYPDAAQKDLTGKPARKPNLDAQIVAQIASATGMQFIPEKESRRKTFAPIDILDYIYAVLHTPAYRARFSEFLKIDFPRVPYPKSAAQFSKLAKLGAKLREAHLLENRTQRLASYPVSGGNTVDNRITAGDFQPAGARKNTGRVYINAKQYFDGIPQTAWEIFIGGYQPAQKWLKDRHGRALSYREILHYQTIIAALDETARIMRNLDTAFAK